MFGKKPRGNTCVKTKKGKVVCGVLIKPKHVFRIYPVNKDSTRDIEREEYILGNRYSVYQESTHPSGSIRGGTLKYFKTRQKAEKFKERSEKKKLSQS